MAVKPCASLRRTSQGGTVMNYESWCKVASVLTLCSLGCKEGLTSPPQRELRPASIDAAVVDQSTAFPTGAPDTTLLKSWRLYSYSSSCNSQVLEIRISAFAADGSGPDYRALYVSSASTSEVTEDAPAVAFRPHDNTIERVSAEALPRTTFASSGANSRASLGTITPMAVCLARQFRALSMGSRTT